MRVAILADTAINEQQKQALLAVYEAFVKENDGAASGTKG